jgi:hypothetical protein
MLLEEEKDLLKEEFIFTNVNPGYRGYFLKPDGTKRWVSFEEAEKLVSYKRMEKLAQEKSKAAVFALKNSIMFTSDKSNIDDITAKLEWLGNDSWYDENNFFFVKDFPKFEGKTIAFQIRVSDHKLVPSRWYFSHVKRFMDVHNQKDAQYSQFAFNIIIDENNRFSKEETERIMRYSKSEGIFVINCNFDEEEKSPEQNLKIADFIKKIITGQRPTMSYNELYQLFGKNDGTGWEEKEYGSGYNDINFTQRNNIAPRFSRKFNFINSGDEEVKQPITSITFTELEKIMSDNTIKKSNVYLDEKNNVVSKDVYDNLKDKSNIKQGIVFNYNGFPYFYYDDKMEVYRVKSKDGKLYFNGKNLIPVTVIMEHKLYLTYNDMYNMINECVKRIIKKRLN